jgi:hypothetical protein
VVPTIITIFARQTGSDVTGTGSFEEPFRTFQRAIRQVPNVIAPGFAYIVDVTDLGVEVFPPGYSIPPFQATVQTYLFLDPSTLPFAVLAALNIRAFPRPFSALPLADTVVPAGDIVAITPVGPGLTSVQVATPHAAWAADGARTAMVIGDGGDAQVNSIVFASDATHLFLANTPDIAVQQLSLVEPSAVFASSGPGSDGPGWQSSEAESLAIQGIKFTIPGGGTGSQVSLGIANTLQPFIELSDMDGLGLFGVALQALTLASVVRGFAAIQGAAWSPRRSLVLNAGMNITGGFGQTFRQTVIDGSSPVGPGSFATNEPGNPPAGWELLNVLIQNGTGPGVNAFGDGVYSLEQVEIDDCVGDGILAADPISVKLDRVTGAGNVLLGLRAEDGAQVRVIDNATNITGLQGDFKAGVQPIRTWVNFRTVAPVKNELDVVSPPIGDETSGPGTGGTSLSRVFQRP